MFVEPCPKCGRQPKIMDCMVIENYKNGIRRRMCTCSNLCSIIPGSDRLNTFGFIFEGNGDDNMIFKRWNDAITLYKENLNKSWYERVYKSFDGGV